VESSYFYGIADPGRSDEYLIIGFDTEFKSPDGPVSRDDIKAGTAKYVVLSYQFHCSVYDEGQPDAQEWSGICYPDEGARLTLSELIIFAVSRGISSGAVTGIPRCIYLVGHFTRADVPAFADFKSLTELFSSVRSTFLSIDGFAPIVVTFPDGTDTMLAVVLRDTMLLTPATSKSLAALGELVGLPKINLDPDPATDQNLKENMDIVLRDDPELFERYAINDAVICVRYLQRLIDQYEALMGFRKVPATLTSIGVDLLVDTWENDLGLKTLEVIGKEKIKEKYFNKKLNRYIGETKTVPLKEVFFHIPLATESYHGGRNEQFWFGPAFEDDWTDYDLAGAYPTAMALIGMPDWRAATPNLDKKAYTLETLGFASVTFEFPASVRFPTLPVRTDNGLVFPRKGKSDCSAPEIALALSLNAKLTINYGVIIPTNLEQPAFADFIRKCITKRTSYPKGSLENLFWKELSNSTYGKTAQGLRKKRVFDIRDKTMQDLPESKITNPFYASYITSFVRAALGELMNLLPKEVCVFSCTTDGFLTNATKEQMNEASTGPIADLYRASRQRLTGQPEMLEIKHQVRKPLGWRTRGQATLKEGLTTKGDD
jgi:hypothetical protein